MAADKLEVLIDISHCVTVQLLDKIATPFQRLTPILRVQELNDAIANTARYNRKSVFQDGGRQTGSSYISYCRLDINAVPNGDNPPIVGVQQINGPIANSARCNRKSVFEDGNRQTGSSYNSASRPDINGVPTANQPFSGSSNSMTLLLILPDVTGSRFLRWRPPNRKYLYLSLYTI